MTDQPPTHPTPQYRRKMLEPDFSKSLSPMNFPYFAMMHGVADAVGKDWPVLCALSTALPNVQLGTGEIAYRAGCSTAKVKRARRALKRAGWIHYPENHPGGEDNLPYRLVDVRDRALVERILARQGVARDANGDADGVLQDPMRCPGGHHAGVNLTPGRIRMTREGGSA